MNGVHLHLIINHFPIFSMLFGIIILGWGIWQKGESIQKIAYILFLVGGVSAYVAIESGEAAEEILEQYAPSISHETIHEHEEIAETALWLSLITGIVSIPALFITDGKKSYEKILRGIVFIFAAVSLGFLLYTAYYGGKIRHPEAYSSNYNISSQESMDCYIGENHHKLPPVNTASFSQNFQQT